MDKDLLIVSSPAHLPTSDHAECIYALCREYSLVLLFYFGDARYDLPDGFLLPANAKILEQQYETIDQTLEELQGHLEGFGVGVISRHKNDLEPLPFVMTGSILQVPPGVKLSFLKPGADLDVRKVEVTGSNDWDLL